MDATLDPSEVERNGYQKRIRELEAEILELRERIKTKNSLLIRWLAVTDMIVESGAAAEWKKVF